MIPPVRASAPNVSVASAPFVPTPVACAVSPFGGTTWHSAHAIGVPRHREHQFVILAVGEGG